MCISIIMLIQAPFTCIWIKSVNHFAFHTCRKQQVKICLWLFSRCWVGNGLRWNRCWRVHWLCVSIWKTFCHCCVNVTHCSPSGVVIFHSCYTRRKFSCWVQIQLPRVHTAPADKTRIKILINLEYGACAKAWIMALKYHIPLPFCLDT